MQIFKILDDLFNQLHWLLEQLHPDIYISSCLSLIISYNCNNINYDIMFSYFNYSFGVLLILIFPFLLLFQHVLRSDVYQLLPTNWFLTKILLTFYSSKNQNVENLLT